MTGNVSNAVVAAQPGSRILGEWMKEREAARASASVGVSKIVPGTEMYDVLTGGIGPMAGVHVTPLSAMTVSAVYASVALIGGAVASLPFHLYKRGEKVRTRYESDLWWLFNESPWGTWTAASAWSWVMQSVLLRADGFQRIHRASRYSNTITGFEPLHPDAVLPYKAPGEPLIYLVATDTGRIDTVLQEDMLHFPGIGFDGVRSLTPIRAALRSSAGIAIAADAYAAAFFQNGARPDFALSTEGSLKQEQIDSLRESWIRRHTGPSAAHMPAVLQGGLKIEQLTMSAEDAQLLGTRQYQTEEIARIFGVPPHMIGHTSKTTSWGTGVEQQSIGFVRYTLMRHLDQIRQEVNRKVWPRSRIFFAEHSLEALLEGDSKAQSEFLAKALGGPGAQGYMSVNEVRRLKNMPPVAGFDEIARAGGSAAPAPTPGGQESSERPGPPDDDEESESTS